MKPVLFGRGTWCFIFETLIYFYEQEIKHIKLILLIKSKKAYDPELEYKRKIYFKDNIFLSYKKIQKGNQEDLIKVLKHVNIEHLKKKINYIINSLPCEECKQHSLMHMSANQIYNSNCFFYIFHFFLELRNHFYNNPIDRSLFNNGNDLLKNKKLLFQKLINTTL